MKIIVTADVHLSGDRPERRRALEQVVGRCEQEDVDYLLIAGDLFDATVDVEVVKADIRDVFSDNSFQTFAIPGNHDRSAYREEDYFGDHIEILTEQPFVQRDLREVNLVAVPFVEGGFKDFVGDLHDARDEDRLNVLLLHGTLSTSIGQVYGEESRYLPFTPEQLLETGFEYVFAGHIHSSPTKKAFGDGDCVFAYPGSPVSITTKETDRRGVWLFNTGECDLRQLTIDSFHYVQEEIDLSPGEAAKELERLEDKLSDQKLENATLLIEPAGFIEIEEGAFFKELEEVAENAGAADYEIDRSNVESAKAILESSLYQQFEQKLEESEDVNERAVRRVALKALSMEERG